jgi:hypothetical protein
MEFLLPLMNAVVYGLQLINTKEARKYLDEMISLRQEYINETLKPLPDQSDELLIRVQSRVLVIYESYLQLKPDAPHS